MENKFHSKQNSKYFNVSFMVCCKKSGCSPTKEKCQSCLQSLIRSSLSSHPAFSFTQLSFTRIPSDDNLKQFIVSFTAHCAKPDCDPYKDRMNECCTAFQEKCEFCLRNTVNNHILQVKDFQAEKIMVI